MSLMSSFDIADDLRDDSGVLVVDDGLCNFTEPVLFIEPVRCSDEGSGLGRASFGLILTGV